MHIEEIIRILHRYKNEHAEKYGIQRIGVFGSAVRDDIREGSDVDVVVNILEADLFLLVGIKNELEESFRNLLILLHTERT